MAINYSEYNTCKLRGKAIEHLKIHKNKDKYLFDFRHEGTRYRKVFKPPIKDTISNNTERANEALLKFKDEKTKTVKTNLTVQEIYQLIYDTSNASDKHKMNFKGTFTNRILPIIGKLHISKVKPVHISTIMDNAYKIDRLTKEPIMDENGKKVPSSARVKNQIHEVLKSIFKKALNDELITDSPLKAHHYVKREYGDEKKLVHNAEEKYRSVYNAIQKLFIDNPKIRALFLFGFHGRRRNEVLKLKWNDILGSTFLIRAENSKVKKDMQFTLAEDIKEALEELYLLKDSEYIFSSNLKPSVPLTNITYYSKKIIKETGIEEFSFHYMRNLAVSALSSMGVDTTHLSSMLGHTDTSTLKKYLSLQRETSSAHTLDVSKKLLGTN